MIEHPILITGAARSGTSMTAGVIDICGAWGGDLAGPNRYNAKGMFENSAIRNEVVKPFLTRQGFDPLCQKPLPDIEKMHEFANNDSFISTWRDKVFAIIHRQGYENDNQWYYKGAKMCLMWPIWAKAFPSARWIIVRRLVDEIVSSCLCTTFMRAYNDPSGWIIWFGEHQKRFEEMIEAKLEIKEVWPQRMIDGDFTEMQNVVNYMCLEWQKDKVTAFIDPKQWNRGKNQRKYRYAKSE